MGKPKAEASALLSAAAALDEAIATYGQAAAEMQRGSLTTRANVQRAAEALGRLVALEDGLGSAVQRVIGAINAARDEVMAEGEAVRRRAREVAERKAALDALLERQAQLGRSAKELSGLLDGLRRGERPVAELLTKLDVLVEDARALSSDARAADFADLADEAHALEQQLAAIRRKAEALAARALKS